MDSTSAELQLKLLQVVECLFQMINVIYTLFVFYQHVINVDLHGLTNLVVKRGIDQPLVGGSSVLQTKRHKDRKSVV